MERLRDETDADSIHEVIRRALAVYECLIEQQRRGARVVVEMDGEKKELMLVP